MSFIKRLIKRLYFAKRNKAKKIQLKSGVNIDFNTEFEGNNVINKNTTLYNSKIGYGTYIGENAVFSNTRIGKYCSIAPNVKTIIAMHPTCKFVSTHPAFFSIRKQAGFTYVEKQLFEEFKYIDKQSNLSVEIGNDVWIGENVIILGGVTIGDGAIIGAGSIVTHNIESYSINVGIPSRKIKYRFDRDEIDFLNNFKWWNKTTEWITENIEEFQDIKEFIKKKEVLKNE